MIDIHCHLLPGIDDGAKSMEQSLEMARVAVNDGITHAILTPHIHAGRWENSAEIIAHSAEQFHQALDKEGIPLSIGYAGEVRVTDLIFQQLEKKEIPFLGEFDGHDVMLLEFPHSHIIPGSEKLVAWLLSKGIKPIIAHPERNKELMASPERLKTFLDLGCLAQVTSGSLVGRFGAKAQKTALYFLEHDQIDCIASDAHNLSARKPGMAEAAEYITSRLGEDKARKLVFDTPWKLVSSQFERPTSD